MTVYRLGSTVMVYTPGLVAHARRMGERKGVNLLGESFPSLGRQALLNLVHGRYQTVGDVVVVADNLKAVAVES